MLVNMTMNSLPTNILLIMKENNVDNITTLKHVYDVSTYRR